jgi:FkbM family methyltransferase
MQLETSLNGGYAGLHGEIVEYDCFRMRDVEDVVSINDPTFIHKAGHRRAFNFTPKVIYDIGANVGIFSRYAISLFPDAKVISVEPDDKNFKYLSDLPYPIKKAIGRSKVYRVRGALNGAHECYMSEGEYLHVIDIADPSQVETVMLDELDFGYENSIMKIDIEGNEVEIFQHEPSIEVLKKIDYFIIELHFYSTGGDVHALFDSFREKMTTHNLEFTNNFLYGLKK